MANEKTIERYRNLIGSIDTFLDLQKQNPILPSSSLSSLTEHLMIEELAQMTGHSRDYFIQSHSDGICFDMVKIKAIRQRIVEESIDLEVFGVWHDVQR